MELLDAGRSVLVVIDLQGKLMDVIHRPAWSSSRPFGS